LKVNWSWIKRRWYEFRTGHSTYCVFILSFTNFAVITYYLLVEKVQFLKTLFPHFAVYAAAFILLYIPLATLIGHFHREKQLSTDIAILATVNPFFRDLARALYLLADGENEEAKKILEKWIKHR